MYKKSQYNILFKRGSHNLLYNSHNGNFVKLNQAYLRSLEMMGKYEEDIPQSHLDSLLEGGFVVEDDTYEQNLYEHLVYSKRYNGTYLHLTIAPTQKCNFRCSYCYEEHLDQDMEQDVENELLGFIERNLVGKTHLSIAWYGGEPLLQAKLISRVTKAVLAMCEHNNVTYSASMVSNGYLLNKRTATIMAEDNQIKTVQITLDGGPETHNKTRFLKNGKDSFEVILNNIKEACDIQKISIRVNVMKEYVEDIYKLFPVLIAAGLNKKVGLYFAPVSATNDVCQSITESCLPTSDFAKWERKLIEHADQLGFDMGSLYPANRGGGVCQAIHTDSYVIDSFGDLFKCWHEVGRKESRIGSLKEGITSEKRLVKWMSWRTPSKCSTCNILPLCQGRCPELSLDNQAFECHQMKYNIKNILFRYFEKFYQPEVVQDSDSEQPVNKS